MDWLTDKLTNQLSDSLIQRHADVFSRQNIDVKERAARRNKDSYVTRTGIETLSENSHMS